MSSQTPPYHSNEVSGSKLIGTAWDVIVKEMRYSHFRVNLSMANQLNFHHEWWLLRFENKFWTASIPISGTSNAIFTPTTY